MYFCIVVLLQFTGLTANPKVARTEYGANACYYVGLLIVKSSALFFYGRVFGIKRNFRIQLWTVGILNFLIGISFAFAATFYCIPARKVWDQKVPGSCGKLEVIYVAATVLHVFTDLIVLILPMRHLYEIQISQSKKWGLYGIFFLGYGCVDILPLDMPIYQPMDGADSLSQNTPLITREARICRKGTSHTV